MSDIVERLRRDVIAALQKWRNEDHADAIMLSRHDVCMLLDEIERLRRERMALDEALRQEIHRGTVRSQ